MGHSARMQTYPVTHKAFVHKLRPNIPALRFLAGSVKGNYNAIGADDFRYQFFKLNIQKIKLPVVNIDSLV